MARIRTIKPEFWRHPVLGRLPDDQQLLALALLSMSDDHGYFRAEPALIRGDVQPFREDLATISRGLTKLSEIGWIEVVNHPEQGAIGKIAKWEDHQKVDHPKPSKLKVYFIREDFARDSRCSRESIALEQGTGNREGEQGRGAAKEPLQTTSSGTPQGLTQIEYARKLLEEIGLPETGNIRLIADTISADAKKHSLTKAQSFEFIREQALHDQDKGVEINRFYWTDAKFRRTANQPKTKVMNDERVQREIDIARQRASAAS